MFETLTSRNRATLEAAARIFVPPGGQIEPGADDVGLVDRILDEVAEYPKRVRRQIRLFLTVFEYLPFASGHPRPFTRLDPHAQEAVLEANYHHPWAIRRQITSLMKQLCYTAYLQIPEVEAAVGYRYECERPREAVDADPEEQIHH